MERANANQCGNESVFFFLSRVEGAQESSNSTRLWRLFSSFGVAFAARPDLNSSWRSQKTLIANGLGSCPKPPREWSHPASSIRPLKLDSLFQECLFAKHHWGRGANMHGIGCEVAIAITIFYLWFATIAAEQRLSPKRKER